MTPSFFIADAAATVCTKGAESRPLGRGGHPRRDRGFLQRRMCAPRCQGWRGAESSGAERHTECLALTPSRAALFSSPIFFFGGLMAARTSGATGERRGRRKAVKP